MKDEAARDRSRRVAAPPTDEIARAARALRAGDLVVFPTETVYGVGANALDREAVLKIFRAKGRPADNPVIVHVADDAHARALARAWPPAADALARAFWPGPLTLVLPRDARVPDEVTGGLDSVAVRVPDHPVALALLRAADVPVAAPSANRSGRPSPTTVAHARSDLGDAVACYLDGGPARVGVESTVVSLLGPVPVVLRPGGVPRERIADVVGRVDALAARDAAAPALSPGTKYRHYAPRARVVLAGDPARAASELRASGARVAIVASRESGLAGADVRVPGARDDAQAWARAIFALLRELDEAGFDAIVVEPIPERGLGAAVMNRLRKAAERA